MRKSRLVAMGIAAIMMTTTVAEGTVADVYAQQMSTKEEEMLLAEDVVEETGDAAEDVAGETEDAAEDVAGETEDTTEGTEEIYTDEKEAKELEKQQETEAIDDTVAQEEEATGSYGKVGGLHQTYASDDRIGFEFECTLGAKYYQVQYSQDQQNWFEMYLYGESSHNYSGGELLLTTRKHQINPGKDYYIRVRATATQSGDNHTNIGPWSDILKVSTAPREEVKEIKQTDATVTSATLAWTKVEGANGYCINYWPKNSDEKNSQEAYVKDNKVTLKQLRKNEQYNYRIRPYRDSGSYKAINQIYFTINRFKVLPTKIKGIRLANIWKYSGCRVGWDSIGTSDGVECELYCKTAKGWKKISHVDRGYITSADYSSSMVDWKSFYKFRLRGYLKLNAEKKIQGSWSEYFVFAGDPKEIAIKRLSNGKNRISWSKITGATSYTVYITDDNNRGSKGEKVKTTSGNGVTVTKYKNRPLKKNKVYYYTIIANFKDGKKTYHSTPIYKYH